MAGVLTRPWILRTRLTYILFPVGKQFHVLLEFLFRGDESSLFGKRCSQVKCQNNGRQSRKGDRDHPASQESMGRCLLAKQCCCTCSKPRGGGDRMGRGILPQEIPNGVFLQSFVIVVAVLIHSFQ